MSVRVWRAGHLPPATARIPARRNIRRTALRERNTPGPRSSSAKSASSAVHSPDVVIVCSDLLVVCSDLLVVCSDLLVGIVRSCTVTSLVCDSVLCPLTPGHGADAPRSPTDSCPLSPEKTGRPARNREPDLPPRGFKVPACGLRLRLQSDLPPALNRAEAALADHPLASDGSLDQPPDATKHQSLPSSECCAFFLRHFFSEKRGVVELARAQARRVVPRPAELLRVPLRVTATLARPQRRWEDVSLADHTAAPRGVAPGALSAGATFRRPAPISGLTSD
jgi:hypothetical protein